MTDSEVAIYTSFPLEYWGGGERFSVELANYLNDSGLPTSLLSPPERRSLRTGSSWSAVAPRVHGRLARVDFEDGGWFWGHLGIYAPTPTIESLKSHRVNLVFLHRLPNPRYLRKLALIGTPVIFLVHGIAIERLPVGDPRANLYQLYLRVAFSTQKFLFHYNNIYYVVLNKTAYDFIRRSGVESSHLRLIPNSIDPGDFSVSRNDTEFNIVYLGRFNDVQKGISLLALTMRRLLSRRLPNMAITAIGWGEDVKLLYRDLDGSDQVRVITDATDERKRQILSSASLFLCTSNMDPNPVSVLEALASGLPVVSTPVAGVAPIISRHPLLGETVGFHSEGFVRSVERYYQAWSRDPEYYFLNRVRIREIAEALMDRPHVFRCYRSLIEQLAT